MDDIFEIIKKIGTEKIKNQDSGSIESTALFFGSSGSSKSSLIARFLEKGKH
jgi:putative ribosome biogenesis GTPase RsgA